MNWQTLKQSTIQRRDLGAPPSPESTIDNLSQPEAIVDAVDGRSVRATGRTVQLNLKVRAEFKQRAKIRAAKEGLLITELMERALDAYERQADEHR